MEMPDNSAVCFLPIIFKAADDPWQPVTLTKEVRRKFCGLLFDRCSYFSLFVLGLNSFDIAVGLLVFNLFSLRIVKNNTVTVL